MVLESLFQVITQSFLFVGGTIVAVNALSENPFGRTNKGSWYNLWKSADAKKDARAWPFLLSIPIALFIHLVVMALFEVGFFIFYHNHGANDGLVVHLLPLLAAITSFVLYTFWVVLILATQGNCNVFFVQILSMFFMIMGIILMFDVHSLSANAFWFIPFLGWQFFLTVKTFLENYQKHD